MQEIKKKQLSRQCIGTLKPCLVEATSDWICSLVFVKSNGYVAVNGNVIRIQYDRRANPFNQVLLRCSLLGIFQHLAQKTPVHHNQSVLYPSMIKFKLEYTYLSQPPRLQPRRRNTSCTHHSLSRRGGQRCVESALFFSHLTPICSMPISREKEVDKFNTYSRNMKGHQHHPRFIYLLSKWPALPKIQWKCRPTKTNVLFLSILCQNLSI